MSKYQDQARARAKASMPGFSKGPDPVMPPKANNNMARASNDVTARESKVRPIPKNNYAKGGSVKHPDVKEDKAMATGGVAKFRHGVSTKDGTPIKQPQNKPRYNT